MGPEIKTVETSLGEILESKELKSLNMDLVSGGITIQTTDKVVRKDGTVVNTSTFGSISIPATGGTSTGAPGMPANTQLSVEQVAQIQSAKEAFLTVLKSVLDSNVEIIEVTE